MAQHTIPITHGLHCPCCGQNTRREWFQPPLLPGRSAIQTTDCLNPDCPRYYDTVSLPEFLRRCEADKLRSAKYLP